MYFEIIEFSDSHIYCGSFIILKLTICLMYVNTSRPKYSNSIYLNLNLLCASLDVRRYVIELTMCVSCGVCLK
jgi:hypothetical protein